MWIIAKDKAYEPKDRAYKPNDMHPFEEHPQAMERSAECIRSGVHTAFFNDWIDPNDLSIEIHNTTSRNTERDVGWGA